MKSILLWLVFILFFHKPFAQVVRTPVSAIYTQVNTYSKVNSDAFSFGSNQGSLGTIKNFSAGLYGERRFLLEDLGMYAAVVTLPTSNGSFGIKANYFGSELFNETLLGVAYGRKLSDKFNVGVQFNYVSYNLGSYGNSSAITFDAAALLSLTEQLNVGVHVYNPNGSKLRSGEEEKLSSVYKLGLGYDVSDRFYFGAAVEKTEDLPISVNAGFQYKIDKLIARAGVNSGTSVYYLGFGFLINGFRIDATASFHPNLGVTPGMLMLYSGKP